MPSPTTPSSESTQPVDCAGTWVNEGTCNVTVCDASNNIFGRGKQAQKFDVSTYPRNDGRPCPSGLSRNIDCSTPAPHPQCVECGAGSSGNWNLGTFCDVSRCSGVRGIGIRTDVWNYDRLSALDNCVIPPNRKTECASENFPLCTCKYDFSGNETCNENNTVCNLETSTCTKNYTIQQQLSGGICPSLANVSPNNIVIQPTDQRCVSQVTRSDPSWNFTTVRCDGNTPIGTLTREVTVTKSGGYKGGYVNPATTAVVNGVVQTVVESLKANQSTIAELNPNKKFYFKGNNDKIGGSFITIQTISDYRNLDSSNTSCTCTGAWGAWTDVTSCPARNNYSIADSDFKKTISRVRTYGKSTPMPTGFSCTPEIKVVTCPRDCSGNWGAYGSCNASCVGNTTGTSLVGSQTRTFSVIKEALNGKDGSGNDIIGGTGTATTCPVPSSRTDSSACTIPCIVNCRIGDWGNWSTCTGTCGTGTQSRTRQLIQPIHNGTACPIGGAPGTITTETATQSCSLTPCPINCAGYYRGWTAYNQKYCGTRTNEYVITTHPAHGGTGCPSTLTEIDTPSCPQTNRAGIGLMLNGGGCIQTAGGTWPNDWNGVPEYGKNIISHWHNPIRCPNDSRFKVNILNDGRIQSVYNPDLFMAAENGNVDAPIKWYYAENNVGNKNWRLDGTILRNGSGYAMGNWDRSEHNGWMRARSAADDNIAIVNPSG